MLFVVALALVLYSIPFFRPTGEVFGGHRGELPEAVHGRDLELGPILRVTGAHVDLDGHPLGRIDEERTRDALTETLAIHRRNWAILHPREPFPGVLLVAADRDTEYGPLRSLGISAASAGYSQLSFVVLTPDPIPLFDDDFAAAMRD